MSGRKHSDEARKKIYNTMKVDQNTQGAFGR